MFQENTPSLHNSLQIVGASWKYQHNTRVTYQKNEIYDLELAVPQLLVDPSTSAHQQSFCRKKRHRRHKDHLVKLVVDV